MASDDELLEAWRAGSRAAGTELFGRYIENIGQFFSNRGCDPQDVDDLVQRTLVAAAEGVARYRGTASVRTWLFAIAHNILRQWQTERGRQRRRESPLGDTSIAGGDIGLTTMLTTRRQRRVLLEALRRLNIEIQLILQLRYWDDVPAREIGEILGCSEQAARSRLRKAKLELLGVLEALARENPELASTITSLDDWARKLRADWGA